MRRLQDGGYPAYTHIVEVQGAGRRFRVRVGPYAQLDAAQARPAASACSTSWPPTSPAASDARPGACPRRPAMAPLPQVPLVP